MYRISNITLNIENRVADVTERYALDWQEETRKLRIASKWWNDVIEPFKVDDVSLESDIKEYRGIVWSTLSFIYIYIEDFSKDRYNTHPKSCNSISYTKSKCYKGSIFETICCL